MIFLRKYYHWLHGQWPAGHVEKLPVTDATGRTNAAGVYVVGDLRGIPLLKFSADGGTRAVRHILADPAFANARPKRRDGVLDLVIVGAGVSGMAGALEARKAGLDYRILESTEPFSTIVNFPKGKPIYTYPKEMTPAGDLQVTADVKEALVDELQQQTVAQGITPLTEHVERLEQKGGIVVLHIASGMTMKALRVVVGIGRSGNFRTLGVPGEALAKVYNRLHDPKDFCAQNVLVIGGGDSALETAIALGQCGTNVTVSYRKPSFARPKPANIEQLDKLVADPMAQVAVSNPSSERVTTASGDFLGPDRKPGSIRLVMESSVKEIRQDEVTLTTANGDETIPNDAVFTMIGREAPLQFFRRSGIHIHGEWKTATWIGFLAFVAFCVLLYNWKSGGRLDKLFYTHGWFPYALTDTFAAAVQNPKTLLGTTIISAAGPSFWYTLAYCALVVVFGFRRIRRRQTPYVKTQTLTLMAIQVIPLFLLPEIVLPFLEHNGWLWRPLADALFPEVTYGHGREFWRAYGLILAWPLNVYNVFTDTPLWWWLGIAFVQTGVIIPALIYFFGKGAYCGWICSCGALAETLGDTHRHKMPHGPRWSQSNMAGQVVLLAAVLLLVLRIIGWIAPNPTLEKLFVSGKTQYKWIVDVFLAGVVGYGFYFWYSGRVWCRFMCPLAALMHIYARFSRFRILSDKKKCISCNVCTSVCHQGIDIMNFANKGIAMADPECVRCSACVEMCPTGVLTFGQVDAQGHVIKTDTLAASPVQMREG